MPIAATRNDGGGAAHGGTIMRSQALICRAVDGAANQYEISFSSETPDTRFTVPQILLHTADAVDLSRFENGVGALLFEHGFDFSYGSVPIGKIDKAWIDEGTHTGRAIIEMDADDPPSARLQAKLDKGMLTGVSVRGLVESWTELESGIKSPDGRFTGPAILVTKWMPIEISLTPTPVDPTVGYGRSITEEEMFMPERNLTNDGVGNALPTMPIGTVAQTVQTAAAEPVRSLETPAAAQSATAIARSENVLASGLATLAAAPDPVAAERQRSADISALCRSFGLDDTEFIRSGAAVDVVRTQVLAQLQRRNAPVAAGAETGTGVQVTRDEMDKVRSAAADGLLMRCNVHVEHPAEGATEFRGMSLQAIAAECLARSGEAHANRMSRDDLFRRSMTPDSAFVAIADDVANRTVLAAQQLAPTTFQLWTSVASQPDFRPTHIFEVSDGGNLEEIPQNGEFKEAKLSDKEVAVRQLITVGKMVNFTRQLFINDDIGQITRTLTTYTLAFARGINQSVYNILKSNPAMSDGQQLFSEAHHNLGTGTVPGTSSFSEARKLMRQQVDQDGKTKLNIAPVYVLTGSTTETSIEALLASLADPSGANSGVANVFRNKLQMITDAEIDVDSGTQPYFFAANPNLTPTIEVSYLNGNEGPVVESEVSFDHLGIRYRIYGDRGITLLGYRGLVKNPGVSAG